MILSSVADPHHVTADPYPDPHPSCYFDADPDLADCHFDADPDPTFHFYPDPRFQIKSQNLEKVIK
jgi:hypothetical protein